MNHKRVVLLLENSVDREIGRTCPHRLIIEDDELVVHQRRAVIRADFDARVSQHRKLSATRLFIRFESAFVVGHPADIHAALTRRDQCLSHRSEVKFKRRDVNAVLRRVDLFN